MPNTRGNKCERHHFLRARLYALADAQQRQMGRRTGDPTSQSTLNLCRTLANGADQQYRKQVAALLVRRGATVEKYLRLIQNDNSMAAGIAVAGLAAGAAAANNGGGYYPSGGSLQYRLDQFYNEFYQTIWRCRERASGHSFPIILALASL